MLLHDLLVHLTVIQAGDMKNYDEDQASTQKPPNPSATPRNSSPSMTDSDSDVVSYVTSSTIRPSKSVPRHGISSARP